MNNKGRVITITSRKGGVGKSTTLLNLAGIYSNLEKKVLILDFDLTSGSIAISLNLETDKTIYNLVSDITNNRFKEFLIMLPLITTIYTSYQVLKILGVLVILDFVILNKLLIFLGIILMLF